MTGIVRDLIEERDVYRQLGLPQTAVATAALGEDTFAQITVHDTALGEPDIESYTGFVRETVDRSPIPFYRPTMAYLDALTAAAANAHRRA